jgi:hypothetical protein
MIYKNGLGDTMIKYVFIDKYNEKNVSEIRTMKICLFKKCIEDYKILKAEEEVSEVFEAIKV